jgi:DNA mismatch endonuclease (patch repair protein)
MPKTRGDFWQTKIQGNMQRDQMAQRALRELGWRTIVVWECALKGRHRLSPDALGDQLSVWLRVTQDVMKEMRGSQAY